ncbi:MAG: CRP-like cAMP-binding protein [Candidatus Saccharimonadales bacterium]|jgi:CRP-like cAMP-binding protein
MQYKKGEVIIRPQDEPSGIFLIEWGFVKAYTITKYGEENLLLVRSAESVFPLIWAFTGEHRAVTYEAMEETSLWRISKAEYLEFLEKNPDIMPTILDMAIEAYRLHSERVMTLSYRTARERIVSFLLLTAERFGVEKDNRAEIIAPFRQTDIASSVNATRETASRELSSLRKKKLLSTSKGRLVLEDVEALRKLL